MVTIEISKVFESLCDKLLLEKHFNDLQYGFSNGKGCLKSLLSVESIINYYTGRGSSVYEAVLDNSKAFDGINYYSLLQCKLNKFLALLKVIVYQHFHLKVLLVGVVVF